MIAGAGGVVVVLEMQLGVTSKTMQVKVGYTLCTESQKKKNEKLAKVTMGMSRKTIGSVCCLVLVKSCQRRTKGIEEDMCLVSVVNAMLLYSCVVAIGFVLYWMTHLQYCVLATHGAVVKVQIDLNVLTNQH